MALTDGFGQVDLAAGVGDLAEGEVEEGRRGSSCASEL
jgi:hypothetical protein